MICDSLMPLKNVFWGTFTAQFALIVLSVQVGVLESQELNFRRKVNSI